MKKAKIISDYTKQLEVENEELRSRLAKMEEQYIKLEELSDPYIPTWNEDIFYTSKRYYYKSKTLDYGFIEEYSNGNFSIMYLPSHKTMQRLCNLAEAKKILEDKVLHKYYG